MSIRASSLLLALLVAVAASVATRDQESPEALAEAFVKAANAADRTALESLVHPEVAEYMREWHPERWEQVLTGWSNTRFGTDYEVVVRPAREVELYDAEEQTLAFGDKLRFRFPILPPSHFLIIQIEDRVDLDADARARLAGSNAVEAVREGGGRWYLTLPIVEIVPD